MYGNIYNSKEVIRNIFGFALVVITTILFYRLWWLIDNTNSSDCGGTSGGTYNGAYHHPTGPTGPENAEDYEVCNIQY